MATESRRLLFRSGTRAELRSAGQLLPGEAGICTDVNLIIRRRRDEELERPGELDEYSLRHYSAGVIDIAPPELTIDEVTFQLSLPSCRVALYDNVNKQGAIHEYDVPAISGLVTVDMTHQMVYIDYNNGSPIYKIGMYTKELVNYSDKIPIYDIGRFGSTVHSRSHDSVGLGATEKMVEYHAHTKQYTLESGLVITELTSPANRTINVTEGDVYSGMIEEHVLAVNSADPESDLIELWYDGTSWHADRVEQYDNTYYNGVAGKVAATNSAKWLVRWYYRTIGDDKQVYYTLGTAEYNSEANAKAALPRTDLPDFLTWHWVLVGRSVILKGADTGDTQVIYDKELTQAVNLDGYLKSSIVDELPDVNSALLNVLYAMGDPVT